jgi:DNA-directed RNA polymerase sigma subunit (sigma70/sigma32)
MRFAGAIGIVGDVAALRTPELSLPELLTAAEEVSLARRVERGDRAARERMIVANVRLVI